MSKKNVMITMDEELHKKAKERFLNISYEAEKAIRERLGKTQVEIDERIKNCEFCGKEDCLTWLYPDEKWICNSCLKAKSRNITK